MNREERKKEYLKCFIKTFSENGIDRTPVKKLAGEAKMNEASIYQYFKNKDEIVVECVRLYLEGELERLLQVLSDPEEDFESRVRSFLNLSYETADEAKFIIQVLTSPTYSVMCSPIVHDFSKRILSTSSHADAEDEDDSAAKESAVQLLLLSIMIGDRVFGESSLLRVQVECLLHLIDHDGGMCTGVFQDRAFSQRNSA
ncbi:TetR/AcrR family transcriptional regulator [Caproicibacter sp.]|uniref:TetR/AcrR family transcriptional regulator n=1 Tax=Caproicibacter sp. TaxID=2814884 RepID=UPI0039897307